MRNGYSGFDFDVVSGLSVQRCRGETDNPEGTTGNFDERRVRLGFASK